MGKRNKEPQVGRRRPMIQLSGSSQKSGIGVVSRNVVKEEIKETKKPDVMDDQLAGFLAEINSLDDGASSSSSSNQEKVDPVINGPIAEGPKPFYDVETFDPSTQAHLLPENWSAIYDESTSYYYYWNTVTNEVQWYPPAPPSIDAPPPPPPPMEEEEPQKPLPLPDSEKEHPDTNGLHNDDILNSPAPNFDTKVAEDNLLSQKSPEPKDIINEEIPKKEEIKEIEIDNIENTVSSQIGIISSIVESYAETESDTNGHKDDNADKAEIDPYSVTEPIINKELIKEKETKEKTIEDSTVTEEKKVESENSFIDKDKELMSKIKEKIQRKKEEKLRKEKEESILKQKEESNQSAKSKEESLREKLIKKKIDREKGTPEESTITDELKIDTTTPSNVSTPNVDAFSVDIFAAEDAFKKKKGSSPAVTPTSVPFTVNVESIKAKIEEKKKAEKKDVPAKETPATKDNTMKQDISDENSGKEKGVWRIIDAGYDDDDDEDEESDNNETEEKKSKVTEKGKGEMDDYAEMLLEETIVEKDDKEKGKEKSRGKKKKSKRSFVPALPLEAPPPPPPEPTNPPLPPEDEPAPHPPPQAPMEEDGALQEQIKSLTSTLMEKFNVLGVSRSEIGKLQQCLIELEIRMQDWMAGVLESKYFLARLKEVDMEVLKQETAPAGWISHWSSNFKMYYYYHAATGTSQWDYPTVMQQPLTVQPLQPAFPDYQYQTPHMALPTAEIQLMSTENEPSELERSGYATPPQPPPETTSTSTSMTLSATAASLVSPAHGFSRDPIPDKNSKSSRKRAVPQESEKASSDPYRDPYRSNKKKREQVGSDSVSDEGVMGSGSESGTASPLPASVMQSGPVMRGPVPEPPQDITLQYQSMTPPPPPPAADTIESRAMASPKPDLPAQLGKSKVKKKKKSEGLAPLKKLKHVSSLVQKWQTVKQQVEDEENVEEESDDDYEVASEKRINEWKKEMESSDKKNFNPNFQEIKGDWRERLKRKTVT